MITHTHIHTNSDPRQRDARQADREIDTSFRLAYGQARTQSVKNARVLTGVWWLSSPLARCVCVCMRVYMYLCSVCSVGKATPRQERTAITARISFGICVMAPPSSRPTTMRRGLLPPKSAGLLGSSLAPLLLLLLLRLDCSAACALMAECGWAWK